MRDGIFKIIVAGVHYDYCESIIFEIILQGAHHESRETASRDKIVAGSALCFIMKRGFELHCIMGK